MMAKTTCLIVVALALFCGSTVQATLDSPVKSAIDQAVNDAMQKILQGMGAVTNNVASNVGQVTSAVGAITQPIVQSTGTVAQQLVQDYKTMGQTVLNGYKTLGNQMLGSVANIGSTFGVAYDQLEGVLNAYESQYCTPARFTPSIKKPAKFSGPAFELRLSSGSCEFDEFRLLNNNEKILNCVEPSITFTRTPANFTSKYKSAPKFISKECKVTKTFGDPITKVLYVFDGSSPVDLNSITSAVLNEIKQVTGTIGSAHQALAGQLSNFLGAIPNIGSIRLP